MAHTENESPTESQYPKLVRDRIPAIIERQGKIAKTHIADKEEYIQHLLLKLIEEATELQEASQTDHQKEEIADVWEVLDAIQAALGFSRDDIQKIQINKAEERGGFTDGVILDSKPM